MRGLIRVLILGPIVALTAVAGLITLAFATVTSVLGILASYIDEEIS